MHDLGCHEEDLDPEEAYDRYREWLPFTHRNRTFYEGVARDLSYELEVGPGGCPSTRQLRSHQHQATVDDERGAGCVP